MTIPEAEVERNNLLFIAEKTKFVDRCPQIPRPKEGKNNSTLPQRIVGFFQRYSNWKNKLKHHLNSDNQYREIYLPSFLQATGEVPMPHPEHERMIMPEDIMDDNPVEGIDY